MQHSIAQNFFEIPPLNRELIASTLRVKNEKVGHKYQIEHFTNFECQELQSIKYNK